MVPLFEEMVTTLRGAEAALRQEMDQLSRVGSIDEAALQRLCEIGRSFQEQAHSLLVMLAYEDAPSELVRVAEELATYFTDTLCQLEAMQAPDKRVS